MKLKRFFTKKVDVEVLNGTVLRLGPFKTFCIESTNTQMGEKILTIRLSYTGYELIICVDEENLRKLMRAKIGL